MGNKIVYDWHRQDTRMTELKDICVTAAAGWGGGGNNMPYVLEIEPVLLESNQNHATIQTDGISTTLPASMGMGGGYIPMIVEESTVYRGDSITSPTNASNPQSGDPCHTLTNDNRNWLVKETYQKVTGCLDCGISKGTGNQLANQDMFVTNTSVVRRLTPLECERLQGYPDHWTDIGEWTDSKGKLHKDADSPRYKALGNSIALPFWEWMAKRMVSHLDTDHPTMASLFDGIGGFPLVYSRAGCDPIWASEIEEFPIAVTKIRFPE